MIAEGEWEEWQQRPLWSLWVGGSQALKPLQSLTVSGLKSQNREQRSVNQMCSLLPPGSLGYMAGPHAKGWSIYSKEEVRMNEEEEEEGVKRGGSESVWLQTVSSVVSSLTQAH